MVKSKESGMMLPIFLLGLLLFSSGVTAYGGAKAGSSSRPILTAPAKVVPAPRASVRAAATARAGQTSNQSVAVHRARIIILDPFWFDPFWHDPYWYRPYAYPHENLTAGTLKFRVEPQSNAEAQVYINGALASEFKHKHSLRLDPGEYRIEVRKPGYESQARTVHVTAGETLRLNFALTPAT